MNPHIVLYVKRGCGWCAEARDWLDAHGFAYHAVDVLDDPDAFEEMRRISGQTRAPTMRVGDRVLADFGADELEAFLRGHGHG